MLLNEYYTWSKHDRHSKAYTVLMQSDAITMAKHLGLGAPTSEPMCLTCHTTFVPDPAKRGARYSIEDGVSCESCHGPAEHWLASHSTATATHQQNLQNGLHDTVNLEQRAKLCLSCHQGDESKRVTHQLYGAGHPRLRFELDTYGILQPKHWALDSDYKERKEDYLPVRAWLIGQVAQAQGAVDILRNPHPKHQQLAQTAPLADFSVYDCYSCHHSLAQAQWKSRSYAGAPGKVRVNTTALSLVQVALKGSNPELANKLASLTSAIDSEHLQGQSSPTLSSLAHLLSNEVRSAARSAETDHASCSALISALAQLGSSARPLTFELAEQIGMGIQAAIATHPDSAPKHETRLRALFDTIKNPDTFSPARFGKALAAWGPAHVH